MKAIKLKQVVLIILITVICNINAGAEEYQVLLGERAFGISIKSETEDYIKVLGNPDGTINMGKDRVGLIYGQKLLLIFWENKLWEIVAWNNPPIHAMGYIYNGMYPNKYLVVINGKIKPGMLRKNVSNAIKTILSKNEYQDITADEFGMDFIRRDTTVSLGFKYQGLERGSVDDRQILEAVKITFENNNPIMRNK